MWTERKTAKEREIEREREREREKRWCNEREWCQERTKDIQADEVKKIGRCPSIYAHITSRSKRPQEESPSRREKSKSIKAAQVRKKN